MSKFKRLLPICLAVILTLGLGVSAFASSGDTETTRGRTAKALVSDTENEKVSKAKPDLEKKTSSRVNVIEAATSVLGMTKNEVKEAVRTGKVGDLLIAANKVDAFRAAYMAKMKEKLDAAVTAGKMTLADADVKYSEVETKMASYDGTTHLCGKEYHSKMTDKKNKIADSTTT